MARAGLPEGSKAATASAECLRRMKNTSRELPDHELESTLKSYMTELRHGGYSLNFRVNILESASKGYANIWKLESDGQGFVNRPARTTETKRRANRLIGKQTWFKKKPKSPTDPHQNLGKFKRPKSQPHKFQPIESVLFVPFNPNSALKKSIQEVESRLRGNRPVGKVKIVERAGPTVQDLISNKSPWTSSHCGRENCAPCKSKEGSCRAQNLVYKISCMECGKVGRKSIYIGESHRSWWDRSWDHLAALRNKTESYAIVKHWIECHNTMVEPPDFKFEIKQKCTSSLQRQIMEAIHIWNEPCDLLLNGKGEWGLNIIPSSPPQPMVSL